MKRIGIIGGISHYTTIEYYSRIMELYKKLYNDINYPEIVIYSLSHGKFKEFEDKNQIDEYFKYISQGIDGLIKSGAEIVALAANSPHLIVEELRNKFKIPIISAVDSAFYEAKKINVKKGLLLGIKFTMKSSFYQERFKKGSIELISPEDKEQDIINEIIFNELIPGEDINPKAKNKILNIISNYDIDAVILGCMRLPIYFNNQTIEGLKLVNTLEKHIEDILESAIN